MSLEVLPWLVRSEGASHRLFKLLGTEIPQRRVTTHAVVRMFDVIKNTPPRRRLDRSVMPRCSRHQLWTCFVPQLSNAEWTITVVDLPTTAPRPSNRLVKPVFVGERSGDFCLPKADSNDSVVPTSRSPPRTAWHCSDTNAINSPARRTPLPVVAKESTAGEPSRLWIT